MNIITVKTAKEYDAMKKMKKVMSKSMAAKKADKGVDMGKPGKGFAKIANKIGGEKGKRIAGAVFQKLRRAGKL